MESEPTTTPGNTGETPRNLSELAPAAPGVYFDEKTGTLVVRGYKIEPDAVGLEIPPGEQLVEIPFVVAARIAGALGLSDK